METSLQQLERKDLSLVSAAQEFTQQQFVWHQTDALCHCSLPRSSCSKNTGPKIIASKKLNAVIFMSKPKDCKDFVSCLGFAWLHYSLGKP